jgi:hypothetical protein
VVAMSSGRDRSRESLIAMLLVVTVSWVLILVATYVFFVIVRPLGPELHAGDVPSSIAKIGLTIVLGAGLVFGMLGMSRLYLRVFRTPTSPS